MMRKILILILLLTAMALGSSGTDTSWVVEDVADSTTIAEDGYKCYLTLAQAQTALARDLGTADSVQFILITGTWDAADDSGYCYLTGWTTNSDDTLVIKTSAYVNGDVTGDGRHDGKWDNTAYRLEVDPYYGALILGAGVDNITIDGIQIHVTDASSNNIAISDAGYLNATYCPDSSVVVKNCILRGNPDNTSSGTYIGGIFFGTAGSGVPTIKLQIENCIFYDWLGTNGDAACISVNSLDTTMIYNCTFDNFSRVVSLTAASSQGVLQNNLMTNKQGALVMCDEVSGRFMDGGDTCSYNMTDSANFGDLATNANDSVNADGISYVNLGSDDYHLQAGSDGIDIGTDLSSPLFGSGFSTDIDGDTRSTWDIGADEYVAAGGVSHSLSSIDTTATSVIIIDDWSNTTGTIDTIWVWYDTDADIAGADSVMMTTGITQTEDSIIVTGLPENTLHYFWFGLADDNGRDTSSSINLTTLSFTHSHAVRDTGQTSLVIEYDPGNYYSLDTLLCIYWTDSDSGDIDTGRIYADFADPDSITITGLPSDSAVKFTIGMYSDGSYTYDATDTVSTLAATGGCDCSEIQAMLNAFLVDLDTYYDTCSRFVTTDDTIPVNLAKAYGLKAAAQNFATDYTTGQGFAKGPSSVVGSILLLPNNIITDGTLASSCWSMFDTHIDSRLAAYGVSTLTGSDYIGINWSLVSNPSSSVNLSGTTFGTVTNPVVADDTTSTGKFFKTEYYVNPYNYVRNASFEFGTSLVGWTKAVTGNGAADTSTSNVYSGKYSCRMRTVSGTSSVTLTSGIFYADSGLYSFGCNQVLNGSLGGNVFRLRIIDTATSPNIIDYTNIQVTHFIADTTTLDRGLYRLQLYASGTDAGVHADGYVDEVFIQPGMVAAGGAGIDDSTVRRIDSIYYNTDTILDAKISEAGGGATTNEIKTMMESDLNVARDDTKNDYKDGSVAGSGSFPVTIYAIDTSGTDAAVSGIGLTVRDSASGTQQGDKLNTNVSGYRTYALDSGTYLVMGTRTGYAFATPQYITVTDTMTDSIFGYDLEADAPTANMCRVTGYENSGTGGIEGIIIKWQLEIPMGVDSTFYNNWHFIQAENVICTDTSGYWWIDLMPNALIDEDTSTSYKCIIMSPTGGDKVYEGIIVPNTASVDFEAIIPKEKD